MTRIREENINKRTIIINKILKLDELKRTYILLILNFFIIRLKSLFTKKKSLYTYRKICNKILIELDKK